MELVRKHRVTAYEPNTSAVVTPNNSLNIAFVSYSFAALHSCFIHQDTTLEQFYKKSFVDFLGFVVSFFLLPNLAFISATYLLSSNRPSNTSELNPSLLKPLVRASVATFLTASSSCLSCCLYTIELFIANL